MISYFPEIKYNPELINSYIDKVTNLTKYDYPVVDEYGVKRWYNERGELHRLDGPAIIWNDGNKYYYQNGKRHRLDGPAVIHADGREEYWEYGKLIIKD